MAMSSGDRGGVASTPNVTPLIDAMLVLLIIFMVVTPLMARGKEVPLPATRHHSQEKDKLQPVVALDVRSADLVSTHAARGPLPSEVTSEITDLVE